ncbi:MAG: SpoIIE family protein phosphatase [Chloroflexota bacterium]|nr:SpoIIE family protein phosphatase [Chloroflexota bacterium]
MIEPVIGQVPLLATLPPSEIRNLAATLCRVDVPSNRILFREGEYGDRFYIVLEGQLEIVKALGTADERLLGVAGPGDFAGEMSLLDPDGLRTASVRTRTAVQLLEMTREDFNALLHRQPMLAYDMARVLKRRLEAADNAAIRDLQEKNRQLTQAYEELRAAQTQIIEKEKLEHELEVAWEIQRSILPRTLPHLPDFDFGARIVPARLVGGDFFDFIRLRQHRMGIVIGDVSGKGVPAAIFMALTRSLVRAEASRGSPPDRVLQRVNGHLLHMNDKGMFVTVLYGVLDKKTQEFVYARAGHELPILVDGSGEPSRPAFREGQPLGLFPDPRLDIQTLSLPPNSGLLMYTDGVTDVMDVQGSLFGIERLLETVRGSRATTAQALCDDVLQAVAAFHAAAPQYDDVALVAIHAR